MELSSKLLEEIAFNTRPKVEDHKFMIIEESIHEDHSSQPIQTNFKEFKLAVTFLTGFNAIFNVTKRNIKFYFAKLIADEDGFIQKTVPTGAYELESLNEEIKRFIIENSHSTERP